jgi:hypothetical protein
MCKDGLSMRRTKERTIYTLSKYTSANDTEADKAWSLILAGHGVVSISPSYVSRHQLPASVSLPDGTGNKMYVIEAYHAIHCTVCISPMHVPLDTILIDICRQYSAHTMSL